MHTNEKVLRWGQGIRADSDYAHEQILNAALRCYQKYSIHKTGMGQIAAEAQISRTTIYRHFQDRDHVVLEVIFRELYIILEVLHEQIPRELCFAEFMVETLAIADEKIRLSPIFDLIVNESTLLMTRIHDYTIEILSIGGMYFRERFNAASAAGELHSNIEYEEFTAWISHIAAIFIMIPPREGAPNELRPMLWRYLIPSIVRSEAIPADQFAQFMAPVSVREFSVGPSRLRRQRSS